jgi:hypothetical protein
MRTRLLVALASGLTLALGEAGCSSACQDLADRVCQCEAAGQVRTNCQTNVKARINASNPTGDQQSACSDILATCPDPDGDVNQCAWMLNTCPGKVACGLALPTPGGGDGCTTLEPAVTAPLSPAGDAT